MRIGFFLNALASLPRNILSKGVVEAVYVRYRGLPTVASVAQNTLQVGATEATHNFTQATNRFQCLVNYCRQNPMLGKDFFVGRAKFQNCQTHLTQIRDLWVQKKCTGENGRYGQWMLECWKKNILSDACLSHRYMNYMLNQATAAIRTAKDTVNKTVEVATHTIRQLTPESVQDAIAQAEPVSQVLRLTALTDQVVDSTVVCLKARKTKDETEGEEVPCWSTADTIAEAVKYSLAAGACFYFSAPLVLTMGLYTTARALPLLVKQAVQPVTIKIS